MREGNQQWQREDLPSELIRKLDEQGRDVQYNALEKANSPPIAAETTGPTPITTRTTSSSSTMASAGAEEKEKGNDKIKQKEKQIGAQEVVHVESDVHSNSALVIDDPTEEAAKESAATGQVMQSEAALPTRYHWRRLCKYLSMWKRTTKKWRRKSRWTLAPLSPGLSGR